MLFSVDIENATGKNVAYKKRYATQWPLLKHYVQTWMNRVVSENIYCRKKSSVLGMPCHQQRAKSPLQVPLQNYPFFTFQCHKTLCSCTSGILFQLELFLQCLLHSQQEWEQRCQQIPEMRLGVWFVQSRQDHQPRSPKRLNQERRCD